MELYYNLNGLLLKVGILMGFLLGISLVSEANSYSKTNNNLHKKFADFVMSGGGLSDYSPVNESPLRKQIVLLLYERKNASEIAKLLNEPKEKIEKEIKYLIETSFVVERSGKPEPNFLILTRDEANLIRKNAQTDGIQIGKLIEKHWSVVENSYQKLSFADTFPLKRVGFTYVGSVLLEVGMLWHIFFKDGTVLQTYPSRPSPQNKYLRFYCWMIEGKDFEPPYGCNVSANIGKALIMSFGRYTKSRGKFDMDIRNALQALPDPTVEKLLQKLPNYKIPVYTEADLKIAEDLIHDLGGEILLHFKREKPRLEKIFEKLKGAPYTEFSEFFYLYYHYVFAYVTQYLAGHGLFDIPEKEFDYWIQADWIGGLGIFDLPIRVRGK